METRCGNEQKPKIRKERTRGIAVRSKKKLLSKLLAIAKILKCQLRVLGEVGIISL